MLPEGPRTLPCPDLCPRTVYYGDHFRWTTHGHFQLLIARPHLLVSGHQRTMSTSKGCNQWLSLAKTLLKVALVGGNRLLVACTSKCGLVITLGKGKEEVYHTTPILVRVG